MKYKIEETFETISWPEGVSNAPSELVKTAKEMSDRGEIAVFARTVINETLLGWSILTVDQNGVLVVSKRDTTKAE